MVNIPQKSPEPEQFTDKEIIEFVLGKASADVHERICKAMQTDAELRAKVQILSDV